MNYLEYNTEREPLIIPEYGRSIQNMVQDVMQIKDRRKRSEQAQAIVNVMANMNPNLYDIPDFQQKLWDQLFIISNFQLDVDSPYPKPRPEDVYKKPPALPYPQNFPKFRFYGNNIQKLIDVCKDWEESEQKAALVLMIAKHMRKSFVLWNKDAVEDSVIFQHLFDLSQGKINLLEKEPNLLPTNYQQRRNNRYQKNNKNQRKNNNAKQYTPNYQNYKNNNNEEFQNRRRPRIARGDNPTRS